MAGRIGGGAIFFEGRICRQPNAEQRLGNAVVQLTCNSLSLVVKEPIALGCFDLAAQALQAGDLEPARRSELTGIRAVFYTKWMKV